jgi:two-component system chemotaxis response regulator CheB
VAELFTRLAPDHPPILLVQHIEASFVEGFAQWLRGAGRTPVVVARGGERLERGKAYVASADRHIGAGADGTITLSSSPAIAGFRPSGNYLLSSLAQSYGPRALGVILTGMGTDGAEGASALHGAGGFVIAQDEASCAVAGMTNAARKRGAVDLTLTPGSLPGYIR